jgi:CBS domain-containing protein
MDDTGHAVPREPSWHATATTTVELHAHVAAAVYLMQRTHATALVVITNDASRRPIAIITDTDIARVVADGRDINQIHIEELVAEGMLRRLSGHSPAISPPRHGTARSDGRL